MTSLQALEVLTGMQQGDEIAALQVLIDSGEIWNLEGSLGRAAADAIATGDCMLGPTAHRNVWGQRIPSRYDVKPGTKGSPEYAEQFRRGH